jgi:hypothetical protein
LLRPTSNFILVKRLAHKNEKPITPLDNSEWQLVVRKFPENQWAERSVVRLDFGRDSWDFRTNLRR